jgi:hypothetical protein
MNPPMKKKEEERGMRREKVSEESEEEIGEKGEYSSTKQLLSRTLEQG